MKIAVITPSRGLVHTRTIESVRKNIKYLRKYEHVKWEHFFSHDKGIPDAQNYLIKKALAWGADYIWSVEEDNIIPREGLKKMLHYFRLPTVGVSCIDYPITAKKVSGVCRKGNRIMWCPMGCTLMASWIFGKIDEPWFRTDKTWRFISKNPLELLEEDVPNKYGGHDIYFGMQCLKKDILICCTENMTVGHIKVKESDVKSVKSNNEVKEFEIWDTIELHQNYN